MSEDHETPTPQPDQPAEGEDQTLDDLATQDDPAGGRITGRTAGYEEEEEELQA